MYNYCVYYVVYIQYSNRWPLTPSCQCLYPFPESCATFLSFLYPAIQGTCPLKYGVHIRIHVYQVNVWYCCSIFLSCLLMEIWNCSRDLWLGGVEYLCLKWENSLSLSLSLSFLDPWLTYVCSPAACVWSLQWEVSDNALQQPSTNQRHWR